MSSLQENRLHYHELDLRMLRENAERLALESESIECVKFGMILLELFKPDDMVETIANILGRYESNFKDYWCNA